MHLRWKQTFNIIIIFLGVPAVLAISWGSIGSGIDSGAESAASSIGSKGSQLVGDLEGNFDTFENAVESQLSSALANNDGVLAQFTMGHQTYATRSSPPIMNTLLIVSIGHRPSVPN